METCRGLIAQCLPSKKSATDKNIKNSKAVPTSSRNGLQSVADFLPLENIEAPFAVKPKFAKGEGRPSPLRDGPMNPYCC
jgi:hypothetical protein